MLNPEASVGISNAILVWNQEASMALVNIKDFTLDWFRGNPTGARSWTRHYWWDTPATSSGSVCFFAHRVHHSQDQRSLLISLDGIRVDNGDGAEFEIRIPVAKQGSALRVRTYVHSLETDGLTLTIVFGSSSAAGQIRFKLPPVLRGS